MWYPVRTRVSKRQESEFKCHGPDVSKPRSGRACNLYGNCRFNFNRPDTCPSWSGRAHCGYVNCVLKISRPDAPPSWSGSAKSYMEVTCRGRATVRTSVSHPPDSSLKQERFSAEFLENLVVQLSVRMAKVHRPDGVHTKHCGHPFEPPAYK
jgi:hypothetical protein